MIITSETYKALSIFRALSPEDRSALLDLLEELRQSQEKCADSQGKEP